MEIGSEYWLDRSRVISNDYVIPPWLNKFGNIVLTSSGRGAISLILDQVDLKIKRALLPSYICDSVLKPFEEAGYELIYYDINKNFIPENIEIEKIEIGIFFHMGYFGFSTNKALNELIAKLKSKSVVIIEDVTHTLFSNYQRLMGNDFVIGSIRKWFGIPSGGFLASNKIISKKLGSPPSDFLDLRITSLQQKFEYINTKNKPLKEDFLKGFRMAEQILDKDIGVYGIDRISESIIQNMDINDIGRSRRLNFEFLLRNLKDLRGIEVIFKDLEDNVIPMFFPIYVRQERDVLRAGLIKDEIFCPIHWPISRQLNGRLSRTVINIYDSILSVPCDQRYNIDDMSRIVSVIKKLI